MEKKINSGSKPERSSFSFSAKGSRRSAAGRGGPRLG